ncbi:adenomatous polyposis coli protein [Caerostris extrusa]|uniref:Adenomatous polyposis coli protein n=1 Tax=Caerostris extrusa TaxID=172846 RepID=A0AAV4PPX2_CAEEX|nr:adenomatous polyposis coli protein [Caerostris extrusa]
MHSETITDQSVSLDIMESPSSSKTPPSRPQNSPFSPEKDQCLSQESSSSQENEQQKQDEEKDDDLVEACINLGMPSNIDQKHQINTSLHSKISNLFSSITYSRSGIPIKSRLTQSFPAPTIPETTSTSSASQNYLHNIPGSSQSNRSTGRNLSNSSGNICDDNDNLLINSGNLGQRQQREDFASRNDSSESKNIISEAFLSKCLNVCKKYPALSQKSSFEQGKIKTSIPQVVRPVENPNFDAEQHPRQLHIKSQNLPVYTEENISEDNILSSSPSACDESEGQDSDYKSRTSHNRGCEAILRNNKIRSRKSKANRRSMEIRPPSEQSSEDDNKNIFTRDIDVASSQIPNHVVSVPSSESEEKVKEDERTKEKVSRGVIPDLLEGAAYQDGLSQEADQRLQGGCVARTSIPRIMTDSMEVRRRFDDCC